MDHRWEQCSHGRCGQAFHKRSTSWPGPGNHGQSGWDHRTYSRWQDGRRQQNRHGNHQRKLRGEDHRHHDQHQRPGWGRHAAQSMSTPVTLSVWSTTYCKVAYHAAGVAASIGCTAVQTKSRAISLHVSETLAVVALFACVIDQYHPCACAVQSFDIPSVVRGCGQLLDSWPGCLQL
ncbi:hypothetical protein BDV97DRAFT_206848 [Delphinella strobiligena]|nr:hypothetical protein BDV97DRAFT_206848 [Delphinella strobiligena]